MKQKLTTLLLLLVAGMATAQSVDFEQFGMEDPLKITGNISANSVFYHANRNNARAPFTYFLQGSLNLSLYGFAMPISYSFTNQGERLEYQLPFDFNRLSFHPTYKWVTAHIGDASMSFSPYTLNGHQFSGVGIELRPPGRFSISAMGGRLLKATPDNGDPRTVPAFKRMGYGLEIGYDARKFSIGVIGFYAKDLLHSLDSVPEQKNVLPKENLVLSVEGSFKITNKLDVFAEYASSAITQDLRAGEYDGNTRSFAGLFFNNKTSTDYYTALKAGMNYNFGAASVGVAYERIDPGYQTLGAYYFNSDFENITLNAATTLFNNKVNLNFNIGYQRDDLNNQKDNATSRMVGAVNGTIRVNDRLTINGSYSNFRTYTNAKVNQFENINDDNLLDNSLDTLDYRQLTQNASLAVNYVLSQKEKLQQNIVFNYNLSDVANAQNGVVRIGDASVFHNMNAAYSLAFPKQQFTVTAAMNATFNSIGRNDATTLGPTLSANKAFMDNTLNAGLSFSYNVTRNTSGKTAMANIRANVSYQLLKRHHISLRLIQLFRNSAYQKTTGGLSEFTATLGYNYAFDPTALFKRKTTNKTINLTYDNHHFEGPRERVSQQVVAISKDGEYKSLLNVKKVQSELESLQTKLYQAESKSDKQYKNAVAEYLDYLNTQEKYLDTYNTLLFKSLRKLYNQAVELVYLDEKHIQQAKSRGKEYLAHNHLMYQLQDLSYQRIKANVSPLDRFREKHLSKVIALLKKGKRKAEIQRYLELALVRMYHKMAVEDMYHKKLATEEKMTISP